MNQAKNRSKFRYWWTLLDFLESLGDVTDLKSITVNKKDFENGGRRYVHEAKVKYSNQIGPFVDIDLGHIEECTWDVITPRDKHQDEVRNGAPAHATPIELWRGLIAYLELRSDVVFIRSVTMTDKSINIEFDTA